MKLKELKNKKILILGFGVEGQSTLALLKHFFPDKKIAVADQKDDPNYLDKQKDYDLVIKTPGIPKRFITTAYTTATNIFFANTKAEIIGVTGSKGKSTTASLIYAILKEAGRKVKILGNIGYPMLDELKKRTGEGEIYVVELSSYQLEDLKFSPHIAVFTTFFPEHLDYHQGLEEYWQAKKNIVIGATDKDYFVFNPEIERLKKLSKETKARPAPFLKELPFPREAISLIGEHNVDNVRAAATVAKLFNVADDVIEKAVRKFKPLPHRLALVGTFRGITFYDDAISTTPESTVAALKAVPRVKTLFLGGTNRGYNFAPVADFVITNDIQNIVLFPESGEEINKELRRSAKKLNKKLPEILETCDMKEAVRFAYQKTPKGAVCLLSTASPSYSVWKNFEEKGDLFVKYVKEFA